MRQVLYFLREGVCFVPKEERRPVNVYPVFFLKVNFISDRTTSMPFYKPSLSSSGVRRRAWGFFYAIL